MHGVVDVYILVIERNKGALKGCLYGNTFFMTTNLEVNRRDCDWLFTEAIR